MGNIFADAAAFLYQPVKAVLGAFTPIFIGLMLSYILIPAVDWLCRYMKRGWAILVTYLSVLFCIAGLTYGFVVLIIGSLPSGGISETVNLVYNYFVQSAEAVTGFFRQHFPSDWLPSASESMAGIQSWFRKLLSWGSVDFSSLRNMISKFSGHIVSSVLGIIASVYLLKDKDFFIRTWNALMSLILPQKIHGQLCELWFEIDVVLRTFIRGAFLDSVVVAFLSAVVLTILKVDFAVVIGLVGGILNIIPYFGPVFGMIPAFVAGFFGGGLVHGVAAVAALFLVQQLDCNFIYPKIVGNSTGLHPLYVLFSLSIAGKFFGIIGMILAVPVAGVVQILIKKWACR